MIQISHIRPVSDAEAVRSVSPEAFTDMAERITALPVPRGRRPVRRVASRPWRAGTALAGGLAVAFLLVVAIGNSGTKVGPVSIGPGNAQALTFITRGRYIIVRVRNPLADPARYRAEFAAHHMNITLKLVPASPSIVGTVVYFGGSDIGQITPITAVGKCSTGGGGNRCPVGVRVPVDFHGSANVAFGRAARPGEQYQSSGQAAAPGEAMHGLLFKGRTVATVLAVLRARHVTVPQYRWNKQTSANTFYTEALRPDQTPKNWYVHDALPWAPGQVLLFVGPHPNGP
jgi:hypothetical protein